MIRAWQSEREAIPLTGASLVEKDNATLPRADLRSLERQYTVYKTYEKDPSAPALAILNVIYTQFLHLPIAGTLGATKSDVAAAWLHITQRLANASVYIAAGKSA